MHVLHRLPRFRYCCPAKILGRHCSHPCYAWWSFERRGKGVACCCRDHILGDGTLGMTSKTTADTHDWQKESWESFIHEWMNEALTEWVKNERMSESIAWLSRRNGWWFTHLWTKLSSLYTVYANSSSKSGPTIMRWKEMRHPNRAVAFSDIFFRPWHVSVYLGRLLTSIPFL
jgi:hypothetical protein